jgi:NAD(P)-dependent dehydrogenase (short-subunit alcohol dehydrogenase family)
LTDQLGGKVAIVTGANSGIGKETAAQLASMGAHVVIAARNPAKANAAVDEIAARVGDGRRVETLPLDLASFASVRAFVEQFSSRHDRLDILVNNAGLILRSRTVTEDGHETQFQVNHLGHFLLTNELLDTLAASAPARIVVVASHAHRFARKGVDFDDLDWARRNYRAFSVYATTKLMNIMFTRALSRRCDSQQVTVNALHPGFVASNFAKERDYGVFGNVIMPLSRPFAISVRQGAVTPVFLASSPVVADMTGLYYARCNVEPPAPRALDGAAVERLWDVSARLTGV